MAEDKNALAELAETLDAIMPYVTVGCEVCAIDKHLTSKHAKDFIVVAQRIVAELAKVSDGEWYDFGHESKTFVCKSPTVEIGNVIGRCRKIAEKGV